MYISVVIPIYNEEGSINTLYNRLSRVMEGIHLEYEIIFIDDGSNDDSLKLIRSIINNDNKVKAISFDKNYGQHPAVIAGFEKAQGKFIVTLDADLQNPPEEIPKLIDAINDGYDMVSGIRVLRKDNNFRQLSSACSNIFLNLLTRSHINDYGTMLRVFKKEFAKKMSIHYRRNRLYIPVLINTLTNNILEIELSHENRFAGESKYAFFKLIKTFISIVIRYHRGFTAFLKFFHIIKEDDVLYRVKEQIEIQKSRHI
ncbi:MAG: glycosyltransferase family 2 protein [Patescibacteria group bacterium]